MNVDLYILDLTMAEGGPQVTSASSSSYTDVNEQFLATLVEMGIPQETARQVCSILFPIVYSILLLRL